MMHVLFSFATGLFLLMASACFSESQTVVSEATAFAKFSPLQAFRDQSMTGDHKLVDVDFAAPLLVKSLSDSSVLLEYDSSDFWVRKADIYLPAEEKYLLTGRGLRQKVRPNMRFWSSSVALGEFLSLADVRSAVPEFEEFQGANRISAFKLPVMWSDFADVMGQRSVELAAVVMPLYQDTLARFEKAQGVVALDRNILAIVDVSPDAVSFSQKALENLHSRLGRVFESFQSTFKIDIIAFGANVKSGAVYLGAMEQGTGLTAQLKQFGTPDSFREPLLDGLLVAYNLIRELDDKKIVAIFSGADLKGQTNLTLSESESTLKNPNLDFPSGTTLIFSQITPEAGTDLEKLSRGSFGSANTTYIEFSPNTAASVYTEIDSTLGLYTRRVLSEDELRFVCEPHFDRKEMCILPYVPSTTSRMPQPTRRGKVADWYSTVAWVVRDGEIFQND